MTDRPTDRTTVYVGYQGETVPVRFQGRELCEASTHSNQGPNQNRWHEYTLYATLDTAVPQSYRVLDHYHTQWQGERDHTRLSESMDGPTLARQYPAVTSAALDQGALSDDDVAQDAGDQPIPDDRE